MLILTVSNCYSAEEIADCEFAFTQGNRYKRDTDILAFVSPTVNDTGEFKCATSDSQSGLTVYVAVGKWLAY